MRTYKAINNRWNMHIFFNWIHVSAKARSCIDRNEIWQIDMKSTWITAEHSCVYYTDSTSILIHVHMCNSYTS